MNLSQGNNSKKPTSWIWLILLILTLPCAIQWLVAKTYSQNNVLNDMRFTRVAERAAQLDDAIATLAIDKSLSDSLSAKYQFNCRLLSSVLQNLKDSSPGQRCQSQINEVEELNIARREIEAKGSIDLTTDSSYRELGRIFEQQIQRLIGQIENRTNRTLEQTQIITSAVQYAVIAFAFVLFMTWRQHSRYVEEEERNELLRENLHRAKVAAEDANRIKSEFLANMSHEMRTPLTAIIGMAHLCREAEKMPDQDERLSKIEKAAAGLLKIVNDVLDLSKIEAGKLELEAIPFCLSDALDQARNVIGLSVEEKNLDLIIVSDPQCPAIIGDPFRLNQVLINLLSNAIKFTDSGSITLKVDIKQQQEDSVRLRFCVIDTGIGMTETQSAKIFGMFAQADGSTTRKFGGTGLGLFICKKILASMGGTIKVKSKQGEGSSFSFELEFEKAGSLNTPRIESHSPSASLNRANQQIVKHMVNLERTIASDSEIVTKCGIARNVSQHLEHLESLVDATLTLDLQKMPSEIRELAAELEQRLEAFDSRSVDSFNSLAAMLDEGNQEKIKSVEICIRRFDFVEARQQLFAFCESFGKNTDSRRKLEI